jgi:hypothetical protein
MYRGEEIHHVVFGLVRNELKVGPKIDDPLVHCTSTSRTPMSTYTPIPGPSSPYRYPEAETIRLHDTPPAPRRQSLSSDSDESDIIYRDALDLDPFNEKDTRFRDEGVMEDGAEKDEEEEGYIVEPRTVGPAFNRD